MGQLGEPILANGPRILPSPVLSALCRLQLLEKVQEILNSEFRLLMSTLRRKMILNCLKRRLDLIYDALTEKPSENPFCGRI